MSTVTRSAGTAIRSAAMTTSPRGLRRLFATVTTFPPPPGGTAPHREQAKPSTNLFVSGLSKRTTTEKLHEAFSNFGEVVNARVVTDRVSGYSKGYGFVRYATMEDAEKGKQGMNGKFLDGWVIFTEYAKPRAPHPQPRNYKAPPPPYGQY